MYKKLTMLFALVIVMSLMLTPAFAKGKSGQAGKSNVGHLYLYEKDGEPDWNIVEGGAWGKMKYNLSGSTFDFVFNGHSLAIGQDYTLIYYPDPWPGDGLICLGSGITNEGGNVHIQGSADTGDLPNQDVDINEGAKIWLVLSDDVNCQGAKMVDWDASAYLFEYYLITFDDTDE